MRAPFLLIAALLASGCGDLNKVVINEFVAKNINGLEDNGTHPDWIELYNRGKKPVDIGGWYMTDDRSDPYKWQIPKNVEIEGKGYLLIIADNDPEEGALHATFSLSEDGEDVGLYAGDDKDNVEVDLVASYGAMGEDVSEARKTDGDSEWVRDDTPTPGKPNK